MAVLLGPVFSDEAALASTGRSYYVSTSGSDENPGTEARPFRTIARGVRVLTAGATLYVKGGTYAESLVDSIPSGLSWSMPVRLMAYQRQTVTLKPNAGQEFVLYWRRGQYIIVDGLILDAVNVAYDAVKITGTAQHIRLINSEVKNARWQGILVGSSFNEFINLKIHHNGSLADYNVNGNQRHGIYIGTAHNLVEGCEVYENLHFGVHIFNERYKGADKNTVRNNKIHNHPRKGGIVVNSGTGNMIYNNVVWNGGGGIFVDYGGHDAQIYHNTLYRNRGGYGGIYVGSHASNVRIQNNILYENVGGGVIDYGRSTVKSHNLDGQDPAFVDRHAFDFRLTASSPAVDAGLTISVVTIDLDRVPRPQGRAYDIGAFEFAGYR